MVAAASSASVLLNEIPSRFMPSVTVCALLNRFARQIMMNFAGGSGTE